jgi:hypothetical protein
MVLVGPSCWVCGEVWYEVCYSPSPRRKKVLIFVFIFMPVCVPMSVCVRVCSCVSTAGGVRVRVLRLCPCPCPPMSRQVSVCVSVYMLIPVHAHLRVYLSHPHLQAPDTGSCAGPAPSTGPCSTRPSGEQGVSGRFRTRLLSDLHLAAQEPDPSPRHTSHTSNIFEATRYSYQVA